MRTLSNTNGKKTQTLSVTDQRTTNEIVVGQWRGASEKSEHASETALENYRRIRFWSNDDISVAESWIKIK